MLVGWVIAVVLAFASAPLYAPYAAIVHRPGGLSALNDQRLAAGVMWVPGSLTFTVAILVFFYRWLDPRRNGGSPSPSPETNDPRRSR